jgi:succinoglycan biosynthesis protein ExoM
VKISVCIPTYRRADRLGRLLTDLGQQQLLPDQVVVIDNDAGGSAQATVNQIRATGVPFQLDYGIQPQRNIALTRNRTVELARGDWLAFVDDDERAPPEWLQGLVQAAEKHQADGVLAPVVPQVPADAPAWIRRGRFYDFARMPSGTDVPLHRMRFGNVLLRAAPVRAQAGPFDPNYGLKTGEDADLLIRMVSAGSRIIWSDDAVVYEPVERVRLSLHWLLKRALSGGQEFARKTLRGAYGRVGFLARARLFVQALLQAIVAAGLALLCWPLGRHVAASWLIKVSANIGKLSAFWGWHYHEYAQV